MGCQEKAFERLLSLRNFSQQRDLRSPAAQSQRIRKGEFKRVHPAESRRSYNDECRSHSSEAPRNLSKGTRRQMLS